MPGPGVCPFLIGEALAGVLARDFAGDLARAFAGDVARFGVGEFRVRGAISRKD